MTAISLSFNSTEYGDSRENFPMECNIVTNGETGFMYANAQKVCRPITSSQKIRRVVGDWPASRCHANSVRTYSTCSIAGPKV
mmetsp:Transcript_28568/g.58693  ORF Transcript_28568/g.58693 Transcript_28568/m.58693 type:complete len:83 (-) Transcript_28568:201-449(-)